MSESKRSQRRFKQTNRKKVSGVVQYFEPVFSFHMSKLDFILHTHATTV